MSGPLVAMLSDFGTRDIYVGVMKAVLADIAPDAVALDLTHAVPPQDVWAGAFQLMCAVEDVPGGSIVLAVVDPGVGGPRRALAVAAGDLTFIAPDNGLLSWALVRLARRGRCHLIPGADELRLGTDIRAVHLDKPRFWAERVSSTFHGRDVFAPWPRMSRPDHPGGARDGHGHDPRPALADAAQRRGGRVGGGHRARRPLRQPRH